MLCYRFSITDLFDSTSHNSGYTPRTLGRFALTTTAYKYLNIGISVGSMSFCGAA